MCTCPMCVFVHLRQNGNTGYLCICLCVCVCVCVQDKLSGKLDSGLEGMLPMVLEMQSKLAFIESKHHIHASSLQPLHLSIT